MLESRYKMVVSYDGTNYYGSQLQKNKPTIVNELQKALKTLAKQSFILHPASRTDKGVHAQGQVIHFDSIIEIDGHKWVKGLNKILPCDIQVVSLVKVDPQFHSRYLAKTKQYTYSISYDENTPFNNRYAIYSEVLDVNAMIKASQCLLGEHDFSAFAKTEVGEDSIRKIDEIKITEKPNGLILTITGNGFLRYMVRSIVGNLLMVGKQVVKPEFMKNLLESKSRKHAFKMAPAKGLTLQKIEYEE